MELRPVVPTRTGETTVQNLSQLSQFSWAHSLLHLCPLALTTDFATGARSIALGPGGGDEGIKLTPEGDEAGRPISIVLS